ncbi:MAG: hypothetical protein AAGJ29_04910 [Pseudomonadota bacterium]
MADDQDALSALDRFFDELRLELRANPDLAHRLVKALGATVTFDGALAVELVNPRELAATQGEAAFKETFRTMSAADIRRNLKAHNLATTIDMKGMKQDALVQLAYERALAKINERRIDGQKR